MTKRFKNPKKLFYITKKLKNWTDIQFWKLDSKQEDITKLEVN